MPRAARHRIPWILPSLVVVLGLAPLSGCGDDATGPGVGPLPELKATIERPEGDWFQDPRMIRTALDGEIYVLDSSSYRAGSMRVFSPDGHFRRSFEVPSARFAVGNEHLYFMDVDQQRVKIHDRWTGAYLRDFAFEAAAAADFGFYFNLEATPDGQVWIVDPAVRRIQRYSDQGLQLAAWGQRGTGPGQFEWPFEIALDPRGHVFLLDHDLWRVQEFTPDGVIERSWDLQRTVQYGAEFDGFLRVDDAGSAFVLDRTFEPGRITRLDPGGTQAWWNFPMDEEDPGYVSPRSFDITTRPGIIGAELLVIDGAHGRLARFGRDGSWHGSMGHQYGEQPGEFSAVHDLQVHAGGVVTILGWDRLDRFGPDGRFLESWPLPVGGVYRLSDTAEGGAWLWSENTSRGLFIRLDARGQVDRQWDYPGAVGDCGPFICSTTIRDFDVDSRGNLVVLHSVTAGQQQVERFTPEGQRLDVRQYPVSPGAGSKVQGAFELALDRLDHRWELDAASNFYRWTADDELEFFPWNLETPGGAIVPGRAGFDEAGRLFVFDLATGSTVLFDVSGNNLGRFGEGDPDGNIIGAPSRYPFDVSPDGWTAVAASTRAIQLYGP